MADKMGAYDPTIRERIADQFQQSFEAMGANRYKARKRAQTVTGGPSSNLPLSMGLADVAASVNPAAAVAMLPMYTEEGIRSVEEAGHAAQRGDVIGAGVSGAVGLLELSPAAIGLSKILRNVRKLKPMDIPEVKPIEVRHAVGGAIDARRNRLRALLDDDSYAVGGEVRMRDGGDMEIPTEENIRRSQELIRKPVDRSLSERLVGGAEALGTLGTSAAMTIPGMIYALGTSRGKTRQQMEEEYRRFLERNTYMPRTEAGREYVQELGETLEPLGSLPPVTGIGPGAVLAQPAMRQTAGGLEAAARAGERFAERQVPKIMEQGGLPAQMLKGLTEGTQSFAVAPRIEAPRNELKFYSPLEEAALNLQRNQGRGEGFLNDLKKSGVKEDELEFTGLKEFLAGKPNVTKQDIQDYLNKNKVEVQETVLGNAESKLTTNYRIVEDGYGFNVEANGYKLFPDSVSRDQAESSIAFWMSEELDQLDDTKYSQFTLPGGENYREILLTLPNPKADRLRDLELRYNRGDRLSIEERQERHELLQDDQAKGAYHSNHWDQPNVLAHLRVNDRTDADGKKMLLIEEIQSDWHQAGREKGYQTKNAFDIVETSPGRFVINNKSDGSRVELPGGIVAFATREAAQQAIESGQAMRGYGAKSGVPDAPFKEDWYQLVLKRALQEAVDKGYDRVGLLTGSRQAERYDLSKQVHMISWEEKSKTFRAHSKTGKDLVESNVSAEDLPKLVGKEVADKLLKAQPTPQFKGDTEGPRIVSGLDLQVGGEGMKKYYDEIYPGFLNKYGKKFDAKVGETTINLHGDLQGFMPRESMEIEPVRYIDITPKMREALSKGQPMFKKGGLVAVNRRK